MLSFIQRFQLILAGLFAVAVPLFYSAPAAALFGDSAQQACSGVNLGGSTNCGTAGTNRINRIITRIVNIITIITGIAGVIMIIVGGLKFITAGGDPSKISSAKNTVIYAIIGLIIAASSQAIAIYVLNSAR